MAVLRQPWRLGLAIVAGLAIAILIDIVRVGGVQPWLARHRLPAPYVAMGQRVDIGGRSLYIDCRGSGTPTVVLESGMGVGAGGWSAVHDGIAATARTCAYDRAGLGASDPRGRHTVGDTADDLRSLLSAAGESPPFVLVGHSLGEVYARVFADRYRAETAGLVLVDGFSVDLEVDHIHPMLGDYRPEYEAQAQRFRELVASVESLDWPESEAQLRAADVSGLPIVVLRAPRADPRFDARTNDDIAATWQMAFESLSPGRVRYEVAWGAGHIVQDDRPDLVIFATQEVVAAARQASHP